MKRVRIFEHGVPASTGKVVVVPDSFSEFLLLCGRKLGLKVLQVFLDECEIEDISEIKDGDQLRVRGVKEEFGEDGDVTTLNNGSYTKHALVAVSVQEGDFRRTVAGALGSIAKRLDSMAVQLEALDTRVQVLVTAMGAQGIMETHQQQQQQLLLQQQQQQHAMQLAHQHQQQLLQQSQGARADSGMLPGAPPSATAAAAAASAGAAGGAPPIAGGAPAASSAVTAAGPVAALVPVGGPVAGPPPVLDAAAGGPVGDAWVRWKAEQSKREWRVNQTLEGHTGPVWCLIIVEVRNIVITGSSDATIKIWDLFSCKCRSTLKGHQGIVHSIVELGHVIYSASDDKTIRVWDLNTLECKAVLYEHEDCVVALAVSTDKRYLFSGSYHQIRVWDIQNDHKCIKIFSGHNHWVRALFVAEGYLFSGCHNLMKVWDTNKLELVRTISTNGVGKSIYSINVVGSLLLAGCFENMIQVWDLKTFQLVNKLTAHRGAVYCLAVSGDTLFSGSYDNTVRVWNLQEMKCVQTLKGHTSKVEAICAQLTQSQIPMLFTASSDHSVKLWTPSRVINYN